MLYSQIYTRRIATKVMKAKVKGREKEAKKGMKSAGVGPCLSTSSSS